MGILYLKYEGCPQLGKVPFRGVGYSRRHYLDFSFGGFFFFFRSGSYSRRIDSQIALSAATGIHQPLVHQLKYQIWQTALSEDCCDLGVT